jgi:hypothetical protein
VSFILVAALVLPRLAIAQDQSAEIVAPAWMIAWSPLSSFADLARTLPIAPALPHLLSDPGPRVGLLWVAGNPGATAFDIHESRTEFRAAEDGEHGDYRRPMDAGRVAQLALSGHSWSRLGEQGAVVGRVLFDQQNAAALPFASVASPYTSGPLVPTDTAAPAMARTRARLEGALGLRLGGWGVGFAPGYEAIDNRTQHPRLARLDRVSSFGLRLGVVRDVAGRVQVGLHGTANRSVETLRELAISETGTVYQLDGYSEPDPIPVVTQPYYRRIVRDGSALGLSAAGVLGGVQWSLGWQREERKEGHTSQEKEGPALDRWIVHGSSVLFGAQRRFMTPAPVLVTAAVRWSKYEGRAELADVAGTVFRTAEGVFDVSVEARVAAPDSAWLGALSLSTRRERRNRQDFLALLQSNIVSWAPGASAELAHALAPGLSVAISYAFCKYSAVSQLPQVSSRGPLYSRLIAPELSLYATPATPQRAGAAVRRRVGAGTELWLLAEFHWVAAGDASQRLPSGPVGDRVRRSLTLGVTRGN